MTGVARAPANLAILIALVSAPTLAAEPVKVEICPSTKGLSSKDTGRVMGLLLNAGKPFKVGLAPTGCCPDPACLRQAAFERKITGVVLVEFLRFGPMVRISLRAVNAKTGAEVLQLKSSAPSRGFPGSAQNLSKDIHRAIEALGAGRPAIAVRPKPKPKPMPKPKPKAEPRPKDDPVIGRVDDPGPGPLPRMKPAPGPVISDADAAAIVTRRSTLNWTGGSLLAGGGVLLAVGVGLLAGPFQTAMDERDQARVAWLAADDPTLRDGYYRVMMDRDDAAKTYHIVGWVGLGVGMGMATAGLITVLLTPELPEDAPLARMGVHLQPTLGPQGAGASLNMAW